MSTDIKTIRLQHSEPYVKIKEPPMSKVLILNDDITPMDLVIEVFG